MTILLISEILKLPHITDDTRMFGGRKRCVHACAFYSIGQREVEEYNAKRVIDVWRDCSGGTTSLDTLPSFRCDPNSLFPIVGKVTLLAS